MLIIFSISTNSYWVHLSIIFQDFPSQIVHIAVSCVDKYLMRRKVQRSELQLLGITCMLVAARFVFIEILNYSCYSFQHATLCAKKVMSNRTVVNLAGQEFL